MGNTKYNQIKITSIGKSLSASITTFVGYLISGWSTFLKKVKINAKIVPAIMTKKESSIVIKNPLNKAHLNCQRTPQSQLYAMEIPT